METGLAGEGRGSSREEKPAQMQINTENLFFSPNSAGREEDFHLQCSIYEFLQQFWLNYCSEN